MSSGSLVQPCAMTKHQSVVIVGGNIRRDPRGQFLQLRVRRALTPMADLQTLLEEARDANSNDTVISVPKGRACKF